jgi:hypothetical protein
MPSNLQTPILNNYTRSVNFFNGRLLTGEDLTTEQQANRAARSLLGRAIGPGVAHGLEVAVSVLANTVPNPVLTVSKGLAINRRGAALLLSDDTDIALVRPAGVTNGSTTIFQDCTPVQSGVYVAGAGVYLLTIGPASAAEGLAQVSGVSTGAAPCNSNYKADGVQFRLIQIDQTMGLTLAQLSDANHLRNLVAYKCFGVDEWNSIATDPLGSPPERFGFLDTLRANEALSGCEEPLAVLYWTADLGISFIDLWSVRRPIVPAGAFAHFSPFVSERRGAEGISMFLQFQAQLAALPATLGPRVLSVAATDYFYYLPAAGLIPVGNGVSPSGLDYLKFFSGRTYRNPVFIEGAKLERILRSSFLFPPIDLSKQELLWVYQVRENQQAIDNKSAPAPALYMLFANGQMAFEGEAKYNLNYFNYANYF